LGAIWHPIKGIHRKNRFGSSCRTGKLSAILALLLVYSWSGCKKTTGITPSEQYAAISFSHVFEAYWKYADILIQQYPDLLSFGWMTTSDQRTMT